jgi:hypothetical protein
MLCISLLGFFHCCLSSFGNRHLMFGGEHIFVYHAFLRIYHIFPFLKKFENVNKTFVTPTQHFCIWNFDIFEIWHENSP